jgi:trehalose 6-phosphate synthase
MLSRYLFGMFTFRFILPLLFALTGIAVIATPLAENFVSGWFRRDVELRSQLVFQSVEDSLVDLWNNGKKPEAYRRLFDNIARDERVLGIGLCTATGQQLAKNTQWPTAMECPGAPAIGSFAFANKKIGNGVVLVGSFPLAVTAAEKPYFVVLHDLTFGVRRAHETELYFAGFFIIIALTAALVTIMTARLTLRSWMERLRMSLIDPQSRFSSHRLPREFLPVVREVRQMLRDMRLSNYQLSNIKVEWTPQSLRRLLEQELPNSEVLIVSNREPYIHDRKDGKITVHRPASGVVTALEPITRACSGIWIAHGSGSADKDMVDANDCIAVPPENPEYTLRRIWLTEEEEEGYYFGLSNEGLWPLCHITFVRPNFRESDWQAYKAVNRKFADAILQQVKTKNPVILVQDYHFALLPRMIREQLPEATILTFWHIPWPNPEVFSICPWREEILAGLLGSSVLGFHTQFHCQNFMDTVDRFLESHINRDQSIVAMGDHSTLIRPYPISIAWPPEGLQNVAPAEECRAAIIARFNLRPDALIGVGVERFDYTKGIIDRLIAVRELLRMHPGLRGRFSFIQAAAPTRARLPIYKAIQLETREMADAINKEFGHPGYQPVHLVERHHEPHEVFELFRAANFCVISSLHDGMNLVAKEFIAARDDEQGVLILSTFAGASKELVEALPVNPYDAKGMAEAMYRAVIMPPEEQRERMHLLREMVKDNNIYYWAARILLDAAHLRKRARIERYIAAPAPLALTSDNRAIPDRRAG